MSGISLKNAEDTGSGVYGYYYYVLSNEEIEDKFIPTTEQMLDKMLNKEIRNIDDPMKIEEDGIKTIMVKVRDRAGNISAPITVTVKKDNTPPEPLSLSHKDITAEGFTLNTGTTDNLSSVTYDFYVIEEGEPKLVGTNKDGECIVTGLKPNTTYTCYVIARDEAGNKRESDNIQIQTTKEMPVPSIEIRPKAGTEKGNNDWWRGPVEAVIRYENIYEGEIVRLRYSITGATILSERITEDNEVILDITEEGISKVTAYTIDNRGRKSRIEEKEVKIDSVAPEAPTIMLNGSKGPDAEDVWYRVNIMATIKGGNDATSGIESMTYSITGAEETREKTLEGNVITCTVTENGVNVITAYCVDKAGNVSEKAVKEAKKDTIPPTVTLTPTGGLTKTITAEAAGKDTLSGMHSYTFFYKKEKESNYKEVGTIKTREEKCSYKYSKLDPAVTYNLKVIVTDKAGNQGEAEGKYTTKGEIRIGSYVNYQPESGIYDKINGKATYSGTTENGIFSTENSLIWRVWDIDEDNDKLVLMADNFTNSELKLYGAQGYNNGVLILNDICKTCYSNEKMGAVGRSVNLEDAFACGNYTHHMDYYKDIYLKRGFTITFDSSRTLMLPYIFTQEAYSTLDGNYIGPDIGLEACQQFQYIEPNEKGATNGLIAGYSSINLYCGTQGASGNYTTWNTYPDDFTKGMIISCWKYGRDVWYATRTANTTWTSYEDANFAIVYGGGRSIYYSNPGTLYHTHRRSDQLQEAGRTNPIKPIVDIDLSKCIFAETGGGTSQSDKFSIRPISE